METLSKKEVSLDKNIIFRSNEYAENPERVRLSFNMEDVKRIEKLMRMVKKHDLFSIRIDWPAYELFQDQMDEDNPQEPLENIEWDLCPLDSQVLIIYSFDEFFFYAQTKHDASIQIESAGFSLKEIKKMLTSNN